MCLEHAVVIVIVVAAVCWCQVNRCFVVEVDATIDFLFKALLACCIWCSLLWSLNFHSIDINVLLTCCMLLFPIICFASTKSPKTKVV